MEKLRWLKVYKNSIVGDIFNAGKKSAENFVSQGYAEYVYAPKPIIKKKIEKKKPINKKVKKNTIESKQKLLTTKELKEKIYDMIDLQPIEVDDKITELAKLSGKKPKRILEQFEIVKKVFKDRNKKTKKEAGKGLTEKQFFILEKECAVPKVKEYLKHGIDFINANVMVLSICKVWLKKIMDKKMKTLTVKTEFLSLMLRKEVSEATEVLVKKIENNNYIYTTETDKMPEMYIYEEGIYLPDGESKIRNQLRIILEESYNEWTANQVLVKIKADTGISPDEFFKEGEAYEVPVENGILDLKEIKLKPFDPIKIFFSKLPVKYSPKAKCEKIDKFLSDVLSCDDDKYVFYELAGFGLCKEYFLEKAFMMVGNGRNGKGKTLELLKRLVGFSNCASVPLSAITSESPFVERLWKRFYNLAGDISSKDLKETGMFKQLTGRDPISANRKYKNIVEFTNYAKMVFACNELPRVYDYSDGFWERWVLLEFPYKFVDKNVYEDAKKEDKKMWKIKDPMIIDKISTEEEMSGLLNMALLSLHRLFEQKKFSYSVGTNEVKNKWIRKSDSFMAFCMDCIESDYDSDMTKRELRRLYKEYCSKHKVSGVSDKSIKATLQENFGASEDYKSEAIGGDRDYVWTGIKVKKC